MWTRRRSGRRRRSWSGDLALVLSERLLRTSGFGAGRLDAAMARFDRMRAEMAAGQFLDVSGARDLARVRALKTGSYTAEGPVLIGAALAGGRAGGRGSAAGVRAAGGGGVPAPGRRLGRRSRDRGRRRRRGSGRARHPGARRRAAASRWHRRAGPDRASSSEPRGRPDAGLERGGGRGAAHVREPALGGRGDHERRRVPARRAAVVRLARGGDLRLDAAGRPDLGQRRSATRGSRSRSTWAAPGSRSPASRSWAGPSRSRPRAPRCASRSRPGTRSTGRSWRARGSRGSPRRSVGSGSSAWSRTPSARGITPGGADPPLACSRRRPGHRVCAELHKSVSILCESFHKRWGTSCRARTSSLTSTP